MNPFDIIRDQIAKSVPFARHVGVELIEISDGTGIACLPQTDTSINHIGTQHAGALFTVAEAASGAAMAGALASVLLTVRPVTSRAKVSFLKIAKGRIEGTGRATRPSAEILQILQEKGSVQFEVDVKLTNEAGETVAEMTFEWDVRRTS